MAENGPADAPYPLAPLRVSPVLCYRCPLSQLLVFGNSVSRPLRNVALDGRGLHSLERVAVRNAISSASVLPAVPELRLLLLLLAAFWELYVAYRLDGGHHTRIVEILRNSRLMALMRGASRLLRRGSATAPLLSGESSRHNQWSGRHYRG
jgi:hypothetical protein